MEKSKKESKRPSTPTSKKPPLKSSHTPTKKKRDQLFQKSSTNIWDTSSSTSTSTSKKLIFEFNELYKLFLHKTKIESEAVDEIIRLAKIEGFVDIDNDNDKGMGKKKQKKYYKIFKNKVVGLAIIGSNSSNMITQTGFHYVCSHIDSPRLDLKPNTFFEDGNFCLMKSHYYGSIRKYQWLSTPLSIHGTIYKINGEKVKVSYGEDENDPVFVISDLLPHLNGYQRDKRLTSAIDAEKLNIIVGSIPLDILFKKYGIVEEDFQFGEVSFVAAGKPRDVGFDRGMIGGYGQDDKSCSYCSMKSLFSFANTQPKKTCFSFFFDKEEIGSEGNTGAKTNFLEDFTGDIIEKKTGKRDQHVLRKCLMNSSCISADVTCGINPNFREVHERGNAAELGNGVAITKYTGSGGKFSTNDANAKFLNKIRIAFKNKNIVYQFGLLGKIDLGGGGTIAKLLSAHGMDVVDMGVPLIGMHSLFEISSKADVYMTYLAYKAFFEME